MSIEVFVRLEVDLDQLPSLLEQLKSQLVVYPHRIEIIGDGEATGTIRPGEASAKASTEKLPITLNPVDEEAFKTKLLKTRKAEITIFHADGTVKKKVWEANSFTAKSGVLNNLRSRAEFRNGEWQARGILRVEVKVLGK
ncbi:MAG: hypothetical protein WCP20_08190 [Desulfuromonadales bacterium]